MIVNERVGLVGIGITPAALAIAPLVTESQDSDAGLKLGRLGHGDKVALLVRAGFLVGQQSWIIAEWAAKNGSKRVVTLVNDWAPGLEAETAFRSASPSGGQITDSIRVPLANPDFAPFLQRARDKPDTPFIYFPGLRPAFSPSNSPNVAWHKSGIRIIGPGDLTDDDQRRVTDARRDHGRVLLGRS